MEKPSTVWALNADYVSKAQFESFAGQHPREYASLFANLAKIKGLLDAGNKVGGFRVGFFRSEGGGVYRIGQTSVPSAQESRLYVYPVNESRVMYILGVGTKDNQQSEINEAKAVVLKLRQASETH